MAMTHNGTSSMTDLTPAQRDELYDIAWVTRDGSGIDAGDLFRIYHRSLVVRLIKKRALVMMSDGRYHVAEWAR